MFFAAIRNANFDKGFDIKFNVYLESVTPV